MDDVLSPEELRIKREEEQDIDLMLKKFDSQFIENNEDMFINKKESLLLYKENQNQIFEVNIFKKI
jgi:hypothetical protein